MPASPTFGQIVRERRLSLGLTQADLARRVGCATVTIRKIEYNTLRPSVQIAERLALSLNVPESEQLAFVRLARSELRQTPIPTPAPAPDEIGQEDLSGRSARGFELGERIGTGGFGVVYQAVQPGVERDVAIKIILPEYANHPNFIRRFEAEAKTVAHLEHPHIVPLYDYWREPGAAYLIMRLMRGGSLEDRLESGPIPPRTTRRYLQQIGQALSMAHRHGVVHRDLKPANILLDEDDNAYLADFGIAKHLDPWLTGDDEESGAVVDSPVYAAPEQIRSGSIRPQTDIYCLGILLYEMLAGETPFPGPTPALYIRQHLFASLPAITERNDSLPPELDAILSRATAKNQRDRFPDVLTFLEALESAYAADGERTVLFTPGEAATPQPSQQEIARLENPYKGLRAFTEADSANFFGRDNFIHDLLGRIGDAANGGQDLTRFLAVVGPSGSGKSSVVKAGLIPALRRGGVPGSDNWFVVDMMPGPKPMAELATALMRVAVNPPRDLLEQLQSDERGLLRVVDRILPRDDVTELLLVIDQFEEVFTQVEDEAERSHFLNSLVMAVLDARSRLRLVVTVRADFIDRPLQYVEFGELVRQRTEFVLPLGAEELEEAITRPVWQLGMALEAGLVARIIGDVGDEPGMLPLLQYALTELFERREGPTLTLAGYEKSGGVLGALGRRADEIYDALDPAGQDATRQLFLRLVTLGEGMEVTRRRVLRSELQGLSLEHGNPSSAYPLPVSAFGRFRLLTFDHDPETREPTVEVAHEAILHEWHRLKDWLEESRHDLRMQRKLASATKDWERAGGDPSYHLRGARLAQFEEWAAESSLALIRPENAFLQASITARRQRQSEEEARRQRELQTAQRLAETEHERAEEQALAAHRLRRRAIYLGVAFVAAVILAVMAVAFGRQARRSASLAATREREALANADLAALREAEAVAEGERADAERDAALAARATAQAEAVVRATAEGRANQERTAAEQQARLAFSRELAAAALLALDEDPERSILLAMEALAITHTVEAEEALHQAVQTSRVRQTFASPGDIGNLWVTYHPEGNHLFSSGQNGGVMWDVVTGEVVFTRTVPGIDNRPPEDVTETWINRADFSPDGSLLAVPNEAWTGTEPLTGTITLLVSESGEELLTFPAHHGAVTEVAFHPEGTQLASLGLDGRIHVWEVEASLADGHGVPVATLCCHEEGEWPPAVAYSPDGTRLASVSEDRTVKVWDISAEREIFSVTLDATFTDATFSPDGQFVVVGTRFAGVVYFIDAEQGDVRAIVPARGAEMVEFSPDGRRMATTSPDGTARIWEYSNGEVEEPPLVLSGHTDWVNGFSFSSDGRTVATGSWDRTVRLWDVSTNGGGEFGRYAHDGRVWEVDFSPDGDWLASVGADGVAKIWDVAARKALFNLTGHVGDVRGLAIGANGHTLATAGDDGNARLWDPRTGQELLLIPAHEVQTSGDFRGALSVDLSPDGERLVTGGADRVLRVWDASTAEELFALTGHTNDVDAVAYSPDGRFMASAGSDQTIKVWDAEKGKELWTLSGVPTTIWKIAFSHDGARLAVGHNSGATGGHVVVWQLPGPDAGPQTEPTIALQFEHNSGWVAGVRFSPDDNLLVVPGLNRVSVHDAQTGETTIDLYQPAGAFDAAFSPDGHMIALAGNDGFVQLMAANLEELMDLAHSRVTRTLTMAECQEYLHVDQCPQRGDVFNR